MRSADQVFSKHKQTHSRKQLQDYDYIDRLSESDKDWLAKFTENYYSASFDLNPAFVRTKELIPLIESKISRIKSESSIKKWMDKLTLVKSNTKKFYQVSKNQDKSKDIDLRIIKKVDIFYKNDTGGYSTSKYFKYSDNNIIDPTRDLDRKECNDRSNHQSECVMGKFGALSPNNIDELEDYNPSCSPEDILIRMENEEFEDSLLLK